MNCLKSFLILCLTILSFCIASAQEKIVSRRQSQIMADSIMKEVTKYTGQHRGSVESFDGEAYIKGTTSIRRSNFLMNWFPHAFPFDHTAEGTVFEILNEIHFSKPNRFSVLPVAINSTNKNPIRNQKDAAPILAINLYTENSADNKYILPGTPDARGIYDYRLDSILRGSDEEWYKIRFIPKRKSLKLVSGYISVRKGTPLVSRLEVEGKLDIASFKTSLVYGNTEETYLLPEQTSVTIIYNILNNVAVNNYYCDFKYNQVEIDSITQKKRNKDLDLTKYFSIRNARVPFIADSSFWNSRRKFQLTPQEEELYTRKRTRDSLRQAIIENDTVNSLNYLKMSEKLVSSISFKSGDSHWKYSGFMNPAMVGYSKNLGFSFRQRIRYRKWFPNSRYLSIAPEVGYGSRRNEFFYRLTTDWLYIPQRLGNINLTFKNGSKTYSSSFIDEVNQNIDSINFSFDDLKIRYYNDFHVQLENSYEVLNGLMLYGGISYNYRRAMKIKLKEGEIEIPSQLKDNYADFIPYVRISYTPFQYYKMDGKQKIYLDSPFPTVSLEVAKAISGIMRSSSEFEKWEMDIHQTLHFRKLRSLSYRASMGSFFNQKSEYFVNFRYFQRSNYPDTWDDRIGGVFNLLDFNWYYATPNYVQLHMMYESPFILLHLFKRISKYILSERIYASQLYTPTRPCYTEIGYGIGNYLFNAAVFTSFYKGKISETGFRVTFELGKYW